MNPGRGREIRMKTVKKKNPTFYMLGWLMERMPLYVVQYFLYSLSTRMLSVVANVFVLWLVLKLLESPGEEKGILWVLAGAVVYFLVTEWYRACFKEKIQRKARERLTVLLQKQVYDRALEAEISDYENPQFYQNFLLATDNTEEQIENFLASLTDFCGCVVSVLLTMGVFCQIDAGALFFVFLSTMLTLCVQKKTRKILIEKKRLQKEHDRVGAYYYHCFYLREFAKELRLSGIAGLLIRYDEKNNEEYLENIDAVNTRLFGLGLLGQAVPEYFLMKFLLCAYLAYQVLVEKRVDIAGFATIFTAVGELAANLEQLAGKAFPGILENEIFIENFRAFLEQIYEKKTGRKGKND